MPTAEFVSSGQSEQPNLELVPQRVQEILDGFGIAKALTDVQNEWGEGDLLDLSYKEAKLEYHNAFRFPLLGVHVGSGVEATVPLIAIRYDRVPVGSYWYPGGECRPGHTHGAGYKTRYGNGWRLREGKIKDIKTSLEVVVEPEWKDAHWARWDNGNLVDVSEPSKFSIRLNNWVLPSGRKKISASEIIGVSGLSHEAGSSSYNDGQVYTREIGAGLMPDPSGIVIDSESKGAQKKFNESIEKLAEDRKRRMGNPKDFRAQLKGLIGQLPQEFQDTGKGNAEQFQQWAAAELQPGRFHRLLHRA